VTAIPTHDRRVMVKAAPFNCEAALEALGELITPIEDFYVRSNFPTPPHDPATWRLTVDGLVERPLSLTLDDLLALPSRTLTATLECAGNNRTRLAPIPEGEPWEQGAVSTAIWTGAPLAAVLERAGVRPGAVEVRFEGADRGVPRGRTETISFERSLPIDHARTPDVLLVHRMNDAPLTAEHGAPLRALAPGWYGMAAVKWLQRIEVLDHPLEAHYQTRQYVYERPGVDERPPVRWMRVKSLITSVPTGGRLPVGPVELSGVAWCGDAPVVKVEISADAGPWQAAELLGEPIPYTWRQWRFTWAGAPAGRHSLRARATDANGAVQPDLPDWNRLGYGNNAVQVTLVNVK
jgi:DMSO/TMAO reductase YedYZ molybdopterin-dependent catalytic subunit